MEWVAVKIISYYIYVEFVYMEVLCIMYYVFGVNIIYYRNKYLFIK